MRGTECPCSIGRPRSPHTPHPDRARDRRRDLAAIDVAQFEKLEAQFKSKKASEPGSPEARIGLAVLYWERAYRDAALADVQKREYLTLGLQEVEVALQANPRDAQALTYKGLILRTQATLEPDPEKQQALVSEADKLRAQAIRLRNQK